MMPVIGEWSMTKGNSYDGATRNAVRVFSGRVRKAKPGVSEVTRGFGRLKLRLR